MNNKFLIQIGNKVIDNNQLLRLGLAKTQNTCALE